MHKLYSFLLLSFSAALASCSCYKQQKDAELTPNISVEQKFVKEILNQTELDNNGPVIIKFYSQWCPACQMSSQPYEELAFSYQPRTRTNGISHSCTFADFCSR